MNIIHVSTAKSWRGGEQQIAYLVEELAKKPAVAQAIICRKNSKMAAYCEKMGITHYPFTKRTAIDLNFARKIARIAQQENADIIHPHDSHAHSFTIMAARFFGMKKSIVLHRRVDYPVSKSKASAYKYNHPQIKKIICVSAEVKRILDQSLAHTSKSVVVHSGIDLSKFDLSSDLLREEYGISPSKTIIGNVAAITQQKDYFTFVKAAEKIIENRKDVHFVIVGTGDQKKEIEELVEQKGLAAYFTFTGFRADIARVLPALDILLFPSEKEGLGTTVLDACAAEVAIAASDAGGIPEIITHQKNGLLAPVRDFNAHAQNCLRLINDPAERQKLVAEAKKTAMAFSKENMAKKVFEVYQGVLGL